MNLRYQTLPEAADEVAELMEDEGWLTVADVADLLDIEADEDPEVFKPVVLVLEYMVSRGRAQCLKGSIGDTLYRV